MSKEMEAAREAIAQVLCAMCSPTDWEECREEGVCTYIDDTLDQILSLPMIGVIAKEQPDFNLNQYDVGVFLEGWQLNKKGWRKLVEADAEKGEER